MRSDETPITDDAVHAKPADICTFTSIDLAVSKDDKNWCSNAFFAVLDDDPFRLTLVLESKGKTLAYLKANPNVGIKVVPAGFVDPFAQGEATAVVRDPSDRAETFEVLRRKEPQIEPFLDTPIEALELTVDWWRVTHVAAGLPPGRVLTPGNDPPGGSGGMGQ